MSGGLYKAGGSAWQHVFAIYNPLQTAQFGTWPVLSDLLTAWGSMVAIVSWASVLFQCEFPFMLFNRYTRIAGLLGILSFHLGIALLMGLPCISDHRHCARGLPSSAGVHPASDISTISFCN